MMNEKIITIKEAEDSELTIRHCSGMSAPYEYKGNKIKDCAWIVVESVAIEEKYDTITFWLSLRDSQCMPIRSMDAKYLLHLKRGEGSTDAIARIESAFKDFPTFYDLLLSYEPTDMSIYAFSGHDLSKFELHEKINNHVFGEVYHLDSLLHDYIWTLLLASLHKEYYDNNPNAKVDELYFHDISKQKLQIDKNYFAKAATVTEFDIYGAGYFRELPLKLPLNIIINRYKENIESRLPLIVSMLIHKSSVIDSHISELRGTIWAEIELILKSIPIDSEHKYDITPNGLYRLYKDSQDKLETNEDYFKAITKQLTKYVYSTPLVKGKIRVVYTIDKLGNMHLEYCINKVKSQIENYYTLNKVREDSVYLCYYDINASDYLHTLINNNKKFQGVKGSFKSFNIEDLKLKIKEEYSLISEVKKYRINEEIRCAFDGANGCRACNIAQDCYYKVAHSCPCEETGTMVIFNDYEVGLNLWNKEDEGESSQCGGFTKLVPIYKELSAAGPVYHHYLSLSGNVFISQRPNKFLIDSDSHESKLYVLCYITEGQYNDPKFRDKYPKLAAMYNKLLKVYHEYLAHGEKNPMGEIN